MSKYSDPSNADDIVAEIKTLASLGQVKDLVDRVFPGFIIGTIPRFSKDYATMQENWYKVCTRIGVKPTEILIVDDFYIDENYKIVRCFCETFTRSGFCVRMKHEYTGCTVCGAAIATEENYNLLKKLGQKVPGTWNNKCSTC